MNSFLTKSKNTVPWCFIVGKQRVCLGSRQDVCVLEQNAGGLLGQCQHPASTIVLCRSCGLCPALYAPPTVSWKKGLIGYLSSSHRRWTAAFSAICPRGSILCARLTDLNTPGERVDSRVVTLPFVSLPPFAMWSMALVRSSASWPQ